MWLIFKLMYYNSCNCGTQVPLTFYFTTLLCWKLFFFFHITELCCTPGTSRGQGPFFSQADLNRASPPSPPKPQLCVGKLDG